MSASLLFCAGYELLTSRPGSADTPRHVSEFSNDQAARVEGCLALDAHALAVSLASVGRQSGCRVDLEEHLLVDDTGQTLVEGAGFVLVAVTSVY